MLSSGNQRFGAFEAEAFLARLFEDQEFFKSLGGDEFVQQRLPLGVGQNGPVEDRLHALNQPFALRLVGDVREFHAERAAIRGPQLVDQIAKRPVKRALEIGVRDPLFHIRVAQAKLGQVQ